MKLTLTESTFVQIPEGEQILTIKEAKLMPSGNPTTMVVDFVGENGGTVSSNFNLADPRAIGVMSIFLRCAFNNPKLRDFDTDKLPEIVGKRVKAEIKHTVKDKVKDGVAVAGETVTFVNIAKFLGYAGDATETTEDLEAVDEDDDL